MNKRILVTGSSGFIGHHMVNYLKSKGHWVRGVDINPKQYPSAEDEFIRYDLTNFDAARRATRDIDEVYHFAALMGGMGFISTNQKASFRDSNLININMAEACAMNGVGKLFFSSSACVYPISKQNSLEKNVMKEEDAIPADPNEAYGWEKLMAELRYKEYEKDFKVRIARFENCYGPEGTYQGGKEKAPAAMCRKVALAKDGDEIEVWGDGLQLRSFMYVSDCVRGVYELMQSSYSEPVNLGSEEVISINELAEKVIKISGKKLTIKHIEGPQGVRSRYIDHTRAKTVLGWEAEVSLDEGLKATYDWISKQPAS